MNDGNNMWIHSSEEGIRRVMEGNYAYLMERVEIFYELKPAIKI